MNPHDAIEQAYHNGYEAGYNKGWIVGCEQAMKGIVRCKDCIHMSRLTNTLHCAVWAMCHGMGEDGFCGYAERKEDVK